MIVSCLVIDISNQLLFCFRLYGGHNEVSAYTFYHWPLVDEFVYFSHELVTVPPCCWVDAAHLHGVVIYGEA